MKTIDFSYFIERYITGEMDTTEKKWFEKELEGNEGLRKEVILRRKVDKSLVNHDLISLRSKLADLEKVRRAKAVSDGGRKSVPVRYAAVFTGLMLLGTIMTLMLQNQGSDELFKKYYNPYEIITISRSQNTAQGENLFNKATELYSRGEFSGAAELFSEFLVNNPMRQDARFFKGMAEMETENYPVAIKSLSYLEAENNGLYQDKAMWYLSLCYLAMGDLDNARTELHAISESKLNNYRSKAKKILRKL